MKALRIIKINMNLSYTIIMKKRKKFKMNDRNELLRFYNEACGENFKMISEPSEIMRAFYIDELEEIMKLNNIQKINNISTSGVAPHFRDIVDNLSEEEFEIWKNYHFSSCERKEVQGYSTHMLYIGKK